MDGTIFIIIGNRTPYTADYDKDGNWVQDIHKKAVKADKWVILQWFLFGVNPY